MVVFNKTCIGYNHIYDNIVCQDNSLSYQDDKKIIIAACDGHGGALYIRSNIGSKLACKAVFNVFNKLSLDDKEKLTEEFKEKIKLDILCEWNSLIENHFSNRPFLDDEFEGLNESQIKKLNDNYVKAYGTTMHAAMIQNDIIICVSIGDGGTFLIKGYKVEDAFPNSEDENVANITCSLCDDNAYDYIHLDIFSLSEIDGVLCLTDGVVNPYQSYDNFEKSFVKPIIKELKHDSNLAIKTIKKFICDLGISKGIGDDVSIAMIYTRGDEFGTKESIEKDILTEPKD